MSAKPILLLQRRLFGLKLVATGLHEGVKLVVSHRVSGAA